MLRIMNHITPMHSSIFGGIQMKRVWLKSTFGLLTHSSKPPCKHPRTRSGPQRAPPPAAARLPNAPFSGIAANTYLAIGFLGNVDTDAGGSPAGAACTMR